MTATDAELRDQLAEVAALIDDLPEAEPNTANALTRQSFLTHQTELFAALDLAEREFELEIQFAGPGQRWGTVAATFIGKFLAELQLTVASSVQAIVSAATNHGPFPVGVVGASAMDVVGARPGSFILDLVGPVRDQQLEIVAEPEDQPLPPFDEALERIMAVMDLAEGDVTAGDLPEAVSALGHRAVSHLTELAKALSSNDMTARFLRQSPFVEEVQESGLSPSGARRLETMLTRTEQTTDHFAAVGILTGIRWRSRRFDLEVADGEHTGTYVGSVPDELRDSVRDRFDRAALVTLERTTTRTTVEGEESYSYRLVDIADAPS